MTHALDSVHLTNRKELHRPTEKESFLKAERGRKKEVIRKECVVSGKAALLRGTEGACGLDPVIVLTRSFHGNW